MGGASSGGNREIFLGPTLQAGGVGAWEWNVQDDAMTSSGVNQFLLGLEPEEELTFERWVECIHPEDREPHESALRQALSGTGRFDSEYRVVIAGDRERWLWARGAVDFREPGESVHVVGVNIDITDRKKQQEKSESAEEPFRRAAELKDDFLAMLGHELRNPIGAIANGVALLQSVEGAEHRKWAEEMIGRQTRQLKRLVDDILEVSRVTRGQIEIRPEIVSLASCIEAARDSVRDRIEENGRRFRIQLPEERTYLFADPARVAQVVSNLLSNAIKYTETNGSIVLSAERRADRVFIRVEDDGEGLSEEQMEVVFEPFVRVQRSLGRAGSGLGIGLTLVKNLVELHGGTVHVHSEGLGRGCTFTVELPVHQAEPASESRDTQSELKPLKILIVDDNKDLAVSLKMRLTQKGHDVTLAHDGPEGVAKALEVAPNILLIDVGLPSLDGYQVAVAVRKQARSPVRIAGISGFKENGEKEAAAEVFDHYFLKPVDADQLNAWLVRAARELEAHE